MKIKTLLPIIALAIMVAIGACSNEEITLDAKPNTNPQGRTLSLTTSMPSEPTTRVALEQKDDKSITLTWQAGDELQLAFVQGATKATNIATIASMTADKKKATFDIEIPAEIDLAAVFNLYGVYGAGTIDITGTNPIVTLPTNPYDATSLADVQTRKDVMLSFQSLAVDINGEPISVVFSHLGSLFCITVKNTSTQSLKSITGVSLDGINNPDNQKWAYNSGASGQTYDLVNNEFLNPVSASNFIAFTPAKNSIPVNETVTFWGWYPPLPGVHWPELEIGLSVSSGGSPALLAGRNTLPARTSETAAGKSYYFYAAWDGAELNFTNESFTNELTIDVAEMGKLNSLLSATQKANTTKLTLTGQINKADYEVMKLQMPSLKVVDLSQVTSYEGTTANKIPAAAFGDQTFSLANKTITTIIFPESIANIGSGAFQYCTGLTDNLVLPATLEIIGNNAFESCYGFTGDLIIPDNVTTIGSSAFSICSGFNGTLTLSDELITIGGNAFRDCVNISGNLIIPNKVTTIAGSAFYNCSGFNGTLTLSDELITIGGNAFRDCVNISGNLIIPNKVTTIAGSAFYNCSSFKGTLTLSEELITIGSYAFSHTGFIGDLTIPNKVTTIESGAFYSCKGFNGHLTLPNNITTIKPSTFDNCEGFIGDLAIPSKVTTIALRAFAECKGFNGRLTLPDKLVSIGERAFISCAGLKGDFRMPSTVNSIGNFAFFGCQSITAFEFPHPNLTYSFKMLWSSRDDIGTTPVRVPGNAIDTYKAAEGWKDHLIEELFDEHSVDVPTKGVLGTLLSATQKTITTKLTLTGEINKADYDVMKNEMPNLSVVDLSQVTSYEGETLNKIPDEAFGSQYFDEANQSISTIIFPESVTNIGSSAFQNCRGLKGNLILPATLITIGDFAFYSCTGFTGSLTIPDKVTTIGNDSFKFCNGITSLTLSEGLETIGSGAFYGCDQIIGSIIYPSSLTSIGENGFNECRSVTAFQFLRTTPIAYTDVMLQYEIPVKVPPSTVDAYKSKWGSNASRHTITAW